MNTKPLNTWINLNFLEYGENYSINLQTHEVRNNKTGKILNKYLGNKGYYRVQLYLNNKRKYYYIHQIIWQIYNGDYDKKLYTIDHIDCNRANNSLDNLRLVTKTINSLHISKHNDNKFEYQSYLPDVITINDEHGIFYCKQYDKFYRRILNNEYRELHEHEYKREKSIRIQWRYKNKTYNFNCTKFRALL